MRISRARSRSGGIAGQHLICQTLGPKPDSPDSAAGARSLGYGPYSSSYSLTHTRTVSHHRTQVLQYLACLAQLPSSRTTFSLLGHCSLLGPCSFSIFYLLSSPSHLPSLIASNTLPRHTELYQPNLHLRSASASASASTFPSPYAVLLNFPTVIRRT